jgi:uncharacterized protein YvpB
VKRSFLLGVALVAAFSLTIGCSSARDDEAGTPAANSALEGALLDVPFIAQMPELPRGCEVTSLAMLLRYAGVDADKMTLAEQVDKVPYWVNGGNGNPYDGFVGNMYTFSEPGYGVYHGPIQRLADRYVPGRVIELTGWNFDDVLQQHVAKGRPVWVIANARFYALDPGSFETWHTPSGDVNITWEEHSVVVTGFDADAVYINNPLAGKNERHDRGSFRAAWEQMGSQAITIARDDQDVTPPPSTKGEDPSCNVHGDGRLYCINRPAPMYAGPHLGDAVVDQLQSTNSWFACWGTGDQHAGGNSTWYKTIGDESGQWGWVPGSYLNTSSGFDADPSARGLARCE